MYKMLLKTIATVYGRPVAELLRTKHIENTIDIVRKLYVI